MRQLLPILFLLGFITLVYAGTCSVPDINITLSGTGLVKYTDTDYGLQAGRGVTVTCSWSFDPAPSTSCSCTRGDMNCYGVWMTNSFNGSDFNSLAQVHSLDLNDIDCHNAWCVTPGGRPKEDKNFTQSLSNHLDVTHVIACGFREGQNPDSNQISKRIKLHSYQSSQCTPPATGDFAVDNDCRYHDNELLINQNYVINAGTRHTIEDTNVRFYNPATKPNIISVQGEFDYNGTSKILPSTTQNGDGKIILGFIGIVLVGFIAFIASKTNQEAYA